MIAHDFRMIIITSQAYASNWIHCEQRIYTHLYGLRTTICEKNEMFTFVNMLCQLQADTNEMLVENVRRRQF